MTVGATARKAVFYGSGTAGPFTFNFRILDPSHIVVSTVDAYGNTAALNTPADYICSLVNAGASGGSIVMTQNLPAGSSLVVVGSTPVTQGTQFRNDGAFFAEKHETAFDKATLIQQEAAQFAAATISIPQGDVTGTTTILPAAAARAGKVLVFDSAGNVGVSPFAYVDLQSTINTTFGYLNAAQTAANQAASNANITTTSVITCNNAAATATSKAATATTQAGIATTQAGLATAAYSAFLGGWRGAWGSGQNYAIGDRASDGGSSYICIKAHYSGTNSEPGVGVNWNTYWNVIALRGAPGPGTGDMLASNNLNDLQNKQTALANLGIKSAALQEVGTGPGNVPQLDGSGYLVGDGRNLTNLPIPPQQTVDVNLLCRAWFNTDSSGSILGSYGISSVTQTSAGVQSVNLANPMADTTYSVLANATNGSPESVAVKINSTSNFQLYSRYIYASGSTPTLQSVGLCGAVFGNQ